MHFFCFQIVGVQFVEFRHGAAYFPIVLAESASAKRKIVAAVAGAFIFIFANGASIVVSGVANHELLSQVPNPVENRRSGRGFSREYYIQECSRFG